MKPALPKRKYIHRIEPMDKVEFKSARLIFGETQERWAQKIGVTRRAIIRYETGERKISKNIAVLVRLLVGLELRRGVK